MSSCFVMMLHYADINVCTLSYVLRIYNHFHFQEVAEKSARTLEAQILVSDGP